MQKLSQLVRGSELIVAPVALNPIMARMAEEAGFKAVYMSGGSLGWYKCVTEANITLPEMAQVAVDMRAACKLPIVLDAGGGWGDPMHVQRTIALSEAAGFAAIEIEDQLLPRRSSTTSALGIWCRPIRSRKVKAAIAAPIPISSSSPALLRAASQPRRILAPQRSLQSGADMLFVYTRTPPRMRILGGARSDDVRAARWLCGVRAEGDLAALGFRGGLPVRPLAMVKPCGNPTIAGEGSGPSCRQRARVERRRWAAMATTG